MPLYTFHCARCGAFDSWRPVEEAGTELMCPACGARAGRRFTPPGVARTPAPLRGALDRELRSAHEPEVVGSPAGGRLPLQHAHPH